METEIMRGSILVGQGLPIHGQISVLANIFVLIITVVSVAAKASRGCRKGKRLQNGGDAGSGRYENKIVAGVVYRVAVACCIYIVGCEIAVLAWEAWAKSEWWMLLSQALQVVVWVVASSATWRLKRLGRSSLPLFLRAWWPLSLALCLCTLIRYKTTLPTTYVLLKALCSPALAFLCFVAARGNLGIQKIVNSDLQEPLLEESSDLNVTPYCGAGVVSTVTLSWLNPILKVGYRRALELKDVPALSPKDRAENAYKVLTENWAKLKAAKPEEHPSLAKAIAMSFWREALRNGVFAGVNTMVSYVGPFLISYFVDYLGGKEVFPHEGYILASVFFGAKVVEIVTTRQWYLGVDILGMHVRAALTGQVFEKGMRLSSVARQRHSSGEIINYMAVDVQRIGDYSWYLHDIWVLPLQIILALAILFKNVGLASLATLVATVISILINTPLAKLQEEYQDNLMAAKDDRMRSTSECLRNMRIMKLQAWEERYRLKLEDLRQTEFVSLRKALYAQACVTFIFWGSPIFVSVVTFGTSILLGGQLTAGGVLSALATFRILQEPLRNFPDLLSMIAQTKVSLDRISRFLEEEELPHDATISIPSNSSELAVEIKDGDFSWDPISDKLTLSGINLQVKKGMRVAVCGVVGAGKSSFLSCILGEIPKVSGQVGSLATLILFLIKSCI